jgi:hypothetical protein
MIGVIVRKLTQRTLGETLIGVEILSYRPLSISLTRHANNHFDESLESVAPIPSLYLPNSDPVGKADILVLPAGDFGLKNVFDLQTKFFRYRVRINRVIRKGTDWIGLRFEVIDKQ